MTWFVVSGFVCRNIDDVVAAKLFKIAVAVAPQNGDLPKNSVGVVHTVSFSALREGGRDPTGAGTREPDLPGDLQPAHLLLVERRFEEQVHCRPSQVSGQATASQTSRTHPDSDCGPTEVRKNNM